MFNADERKIIGATILKAAKYYGSNLDDEIVEMILEMYESQNVSCKQICQAYTFFVLNPKNKFWPKAAEIMEIIRPTVSDDSLATATVLRIEEAIGRFGWSNSALAREFIGELGWKAIQRSGGWEIMCQDHGVNINAGTFHAQTRGAIKATLEMIAAGKHDTPIALPEKKGGQRETIENNFSERKLLDLVNIKTIEKE